jgi:hypothetical protein
MERLLAQSMSLGGQELAIEVVLLVENPFHAT